MRVLYVEDNVADADLTRRHLTRQAPAIELTVATSLAEARDCLQAPASFDAALVDLKLPDGSGLELLNWIRKQSLPMAVVMLTGSGDQKAAVIALQAGADDYLSKGANSLEHLSSTLNDACHRFRISNVCRTQLLRVLYAEHHAADIDLTQRHLARFAPHVQLTVVADANQVLERLPLDNSAPSDFDVVLLDYRLPGLDALDVVKVLRAERGLDIPIIIVTGQGSESVSAQAIHLGVDDYLVKHAGYLHELPATLEKVLHQVELTRERIRLREITERLEHVLTTSPVVLYSLQLDQDEPRLNWVSSNIQRLLGYSETQALQVGWWSEHLHPDDREAALAHVSALSDTDQVIHDYRFYDGLGQLRCIHDELRLARTGDGLSGEAIGAWHDITESRLGEQIRETRIAVLDGLTSNRPLPNILEEIVSSLETLHPDMRVSILLRDPSSGLLFTGAAPSLPAFFNEAVNKLKPEVGQGSCGTSAFTGEVVIVEDIREHEFWASYADLAERAGLRACWSIPFKDQSGQVLGTFGIYYDQPRTPTQDELDLIGEFARIAGLAVERGRTEASMRQSAAVFESTREGVVITDLQPRIVSINPAYTTITGYTETEVVGRNPSLLQSGREDLAFYRTMWNSILETGHWQGEIWNRRRSGELFPQLLTVSTVYDSDGLPSNYVGLMTDISQLKDSEARFEHLAHYDSLTKLPNRLLLQSQLKHVLESAERNKRRVAVLYIDLDRFKNINDSLGHPVGDELLEALAQRMQDKLRAEDILGRLGGDEFLLILEDLRRPDDAADVAMEMIHLLEQSFLLPSGHEVYVGASIGISLFPEDGTTSTELIQHADVALYQAKGTGRNTFSFYTPGLTQAVDERLGMEANLRRALAQHEFVVHYQPQVDIHSGKMIGCEALVRWNDPAQGLIPPLRFIHLAEETGLIVPLGEWVLREACRQARAWIDAGLPALSLSVNLSARQMQQPDIVARIAAILKETRLPPEFLKLELTESMIMGHGEEAVALLYTLKALGLRLSIDDFGTGYSSLAYLKRFPIDELKIDQGFVRDIPHDSSDMEIAAAVIGLARGLRLNVVAEGVETEAQRDFLVDQGCHAYQGYLFSRPLPADEYAELLGRAES
ncbi:MAG: EAL domain-containing protein [Sulfuriferula multivorans]|uniref:EAL domain-containing protein n=1 Tax=Sulfuriferula multivorans TaxID=1559896 RepID=A0A7C9P545_9PROT|nr:EAL domain-containing protein [Sulfuriferula multivorans]